MHKNQFLILLIIIGVLAGIAAAKSRFSIEAKNRRVETVVDYVDAYNMSIASRLPFPKVLGSLKRAGITSLALAEDPIDTERTKGAMSVLAVSPMETDLTFTKSFPGQEKRVIDALKNKTSVPFHVDGDTVIVNAPYDEISGLGAGLNPVEVSNALKAGFYICPRVYNYSGATAQSIMWMLNRVHTQCLRKIPRKGTVEMASTVIFNGGEVLGSRSRIDDTIAALAANHFNYGSIEFGKQIGDDILSERVLKNNAEVNVVRVHSIGGNEMPGMDEPTAVGRYILGARERNIRVLYIRLFQSGLFPEPIIRKFPDALGTLPEPLEANVRYIWEIRQGLQEGGLRLGTAKAYRNDPLNEGARASRVLLALMGLAAAAAALLLLRLFTGITGRAYTVVAILALLLGAFLGMRQSSMIGREAMALVAAIALPSIGLVRLRVPRVEPGRLGTFWAIESAFRRYVVTTYWTVLGIILVVGLLADRLFMLHIDEFAGIRLAVIAPMLLTLIYHGLDLADVRPNASWQARRDRIKRRWEDIQYSPLLVGQTVAGLICLAIVGAVVLRSGNDPGVGVSGAEMSFRAILNKILFVRPRTKEFLFGHPLLILGLATAFSGNRRWLTLFLAAGAIGQASLLNTFCHIHTPLLVSSIRAMLGWVIGAGLGALLFYLLRLVWHPQAAPAAHAGVAANAEDNADADETMAASNAL